MNAACLLIYVGFTAQQIQSEDVRRTVATARKGCVKYYGEGACLTKLINRGPDNYHAICLRKENQ